MYPEAGRPRRRRRTRLVLLIVAGALVVLLGIGAAGVVGFRYVSGLVSAAGNSSGGFDDGGGLAEGPVNAPVERLDLVSTVAATGSLTSAKPITLGFPGPGKVTELSVAVGDQVTAGQVMARQDPRLAQLDLDAAKASLVSAERAAGLRAPSSADEKKAQEATVAQARVAVDSATTALERTRAVTDANAGALQAAIDAAQRQLDRDTAAAAAARAGIPAAAAAEPTTQATAAAANELAAAREAAAAARAAVVQAANNLATATAGGNAAAIATAQAALDAATTSSTVADVRVTEAQAVVDAGAAARAATAEARAAAATAETAAAVSSEAVVAARTARTTGSASDAQTVDAARSALAQAKAALQVLVTGNAAGTATQGDTAAGGTSREELQVAVDRAELDVERAQADLDRLTIVAPIAATVTEVNASVGQTLGETTPGDGSGEDAGGGLADVITLTTAQQLVAEITIPETDAIKLEPGMAVELKFGAIPDVVGAGKVLTVLPTEADTQQVFDPYAGPQTTQKTYTVTMSVDSPPPGARGGLSIAARVTVGSEPDVLAVPTAALSEFEGAATVQRVGEDGAIEEVPVEIGLRQGGFTQIVSGLDEGDEVQIGGGFSPDGGQGVDQPRVVDGG